MYNRYACRCDEFRRTEPLNLEPCAEKHGCDPPPQSKSKEANNPFSFLNFKSKGNGNPLSFLNLNSLNIFPKDMDIGDILLFAVLILLFIEKGDEECLIMLLVLLFMN
jgi:hypothetical protein